MHQFPEVLHKGEVVGYVEFDTVMDLVCNPAIRKTHDECAANMRTRNDRDRECTCGAKAACVQLRWPQHDDPVLGEDEPCVWRGFACLPCGVLLASDDAGLSGLGSSTYPTRYWQKAERKYGLWVDPQEACDANPDVA